MPDEVRRQVTDVRALRALADPVRYRLLGHLMSAGPQTASECAAVVGASPSNCSYHLRQLARFELVERVPTPQADGRDRPWQPTATGLRMGPADDERDPDPVAVAANRQLSHSAIDAIVRPSIGLTRDGASAEAERVHLAIEAFVRPTAPLPG